MQSYNYALLNWLPRFKFALCKLTIPLAVVHTYVYVCVWVRRSIDELTDCIEKLADKNSSKNTIDNESDLVEEMESEVGVSGVNEDELEPLSKPQPLGEGTKVARNVSKRKGGRGKEGGERAAGKKDAVGEDGGCCLCGIDSDYRNVSLCLYCQSLCMYVNKNAK